MDKKGVLASELLTELVEKTKEKERISFIEISSHLCDRGFAILIILFAFPMAIPLPYPPGFTTILGLPLLFLSWQMLLGYDKPALPKILANKSINSSHLAFAVNKTEKYFKFLESKLRGRLPYLSSTSGEKIIGFISLLCSISIVMPIMFGNAIPSAGICIMAIGLLSRDGLVIIIGIITSLIGIIVSIFIVVLFLYGAKLAAGGVLSQIHNWLFNFNK